MIVLVIVSLYPYISSRFSLYLRTVNFECIYKKGHHTVKSIRQRETNFIQAATLCSYVASNFIVCSEPNSGKFESASAK